MQNRNFGGLPFCDATENEGVGVIFGDGVENDADAIVCGLSDIFCDVGIVVLCPCFLRSIVNGVQGRWQIAHIEDEVRPEVLDEFVVS